MTTTLFVLWVLYWGSDGRAAITTAEYTSRERCEAAKAAVARTMDTQVAFVWSNKTYSVCTEK